MTPADLLGVPPVWRALVSELCGGRVPDGLPGIRDIDAPCEVFEPVGAPHERAPGNGDCETDGHYICSECVHISLREARRRRDRCEDCGEPLVRSQHGRHVSRDVDCCPICDPDDVAFEDRRSA